MSFIGVIVGMLVCIYVAIEKSKKKVLVDRKNLKVLLEEFFEIASMLSL
jgi:hypothetical protein